MNKKFSLIYSIEDIIDDIKLGKFIIVVDNEDRENEGDLLMAGELITAEAMNFAVKFASGVPVVAISHEIAEKLEISKIPTRNAPEGCAAYAQTVDARFGLTGNGCSMHDRALTLKTLANPQSTVADISIPGHVMPVIAHPQGLREREGHTEAAVALMRIAGLSEVSLLCEILGDKGEPLHGKEVFSFAEKYQIKVINVKNIKNFNI